MQNIENKRLLARSVREGTDRTHSERLTFAEECKKIFLFRTNRRRKAAQREGWMALTGSGLPEEIRKLTAGFAEMQNKENKKLLARSVREGTDRTHSERSTLQRNVKHRN